MKLILTGTSGFVGQEVLQQTLRNPAITSIIALSRKPLPATCMDSKLEVVLIDDFSTYPPAAIEKLEGADACIWMIGAKSTDPVITRKVTIDYTMAGVNAFSRLKPNSGEIFRFVFTSGILAVRDQKKALLLFTEARHVAGEAETLLEEFATTHAEGFEAFIMRPSAVLKKEDSVKNFVMGFVESIRIDYLAAAMVDVAVNGAEMQTWENGDLVKRGREVLGKWVVDT